MNTFARTLLVPVALTAAACSAPPPAAPAVAEAELSTATPALAVTPATVTPATVTPAAAAADAPHVPGPCSVVYESDAVIHGTVDQVWDTLTDLPRYHEWNPWVVSASGTLAPGGSVVVQVVLNGRQQKADHTVLTVNPKSDFCWRDAGWNSWFVYGQRCRWLTPHADGTVGYHVELLLDGPIDWLADWTNGKALREGMAAETAALKQHVESL
jgi:hypothetical protein